MALFRATNSISTGNCAREEIEGDASTGMCDKKSNNNTKMAILVMRRRWQVHLSPVVFGVKKPTCLMAYKTQNDAHESLLPKL